MTDLIRETLTAVLGFCIPEEITVDGIVSRYYKEEDDDGDYIEYYGYSSNEEHDWEINIWLSGCDANIRASIDCDEIDCISVNINNEPYLDGPIDELCKEIEKELVG